MTRRSQHGHAAAELRRRAEAELRRKRAMLELVRRETERCSSLLAMPRDESIFSQLATVDAALAHVAAVMERTQKGNDR